jgi:carbamate kinase
VDHGTLVVCGGGVPVSRQDGGSLTGVEGVVDKDRTSALLAQELNADCLLLLTDVDAVYSGWGTGNAKPIRSATPAELRKRSFDAGSMAPKVEAACRFVEHGGGFAAIGSLFDAPEILRERQGTIILAGPGPAAGDQLIQRMS